MASRVQAPRRELKSQTLKDALRANVVEVVANYCQVVAIRALWETDPGKQDQQQIAENLIAGKNFIF